MSGAEDQSAATSLHALFADKARPVKTGPTKAPPKAIKRLRPPPVSIRLNQNELEQLQRDAAGMSLSGYIRERLFDEVATRKTRGKFPVKDHQALAQVLAALGRTNLAGGFGRIAQGIEDGHAHLDPALERDIRQACADVAEMRSDLIRALGLSPE